MKAKGETLILHQSDIDKFVKCPEQFRATYGITPSGDFDESPLRAETDAASVGTTLHAVIEHDLSVGHKTLAQAKKFARNYLGNLILQYLEDGAAYLTSSFGDDPKKALNALDILVERYWHSEFRQLLGAIATEHPKALLLEHQFEVPFIEKRKGRYSTIKLAGTIDVVDTYNHRIVDHKSSSSNHSYKRWEKQRWAIQPTVYTYAGATLGLIDRHEQGYRFDFNLYTYKANDTPEQITVWRDTGQWGWLTQVVTNMVGMIESGLEAWPLNDSHALCSPKWCPNWHACKGTFVDDDWT